MFDIKPFMHDKVAVVIGRMQLPHNGHLALLKRALAVAPRVLVVLGSAFRSRDFDNPFHDFERVSLVRSMLSADEAERVDFLPVKDYYDDERWTAAVRYGVSAWAPQARRPILVCCRKDQATGFYLDHFSDWEQEVVDYQDNLNASDLRNVFFGAENVGSALSVLQPYTPPGVVDYLQAWSKLPIYDERRADHARILRYRKDYPENCYRTADAIVHIGNKILLVRRNCDIGTGLWALPGGFVDPGERSLDAALRELKEETKFPLPRSVMLRALKDKEEFDHPRRSPRGRLVSMGYYFRMEATTIGYPEVHAADGTKEAVWVDTGDLPSMTRNMFEDHDNIIDCFLTRNG